MDEKILFVYCGTALIVILIMILLAQMFQRQKTSLIVPRKFEVIVETPKGLVSADSRKISDELARVRNELQHKKKINCKNFEPLIRKAVDELRDFIRENPVSEDTLCKLNIDKNNMQQALRRSVTPDPVDWENDYKTLLETEDELRDLHQNPQAQLTYLLNNLDVAARLLRGKVCERGKINLTRLYTLLMELNIEVCTHGSDYIAETPAERYLDEHKGYTPPFSSYRPHVEPMEVSRESMTARNTVPRFDYLESYASASNGYADQEDVPKDDVNRRSLGNTLPVTSTRFDSQRNIADNRASQEVALRVTQYKARMYNSKLRGSTLLDLTMEGLAERDIAGYRPIGHSVGTSDKLSHMTTRVNGCLGKTPTDDNLLAQCVSHDISRMLALNGEPEELISGLDLTYHA